MEGRSWGRQLEEGKINEWRKMSGTDQVREEVRNDEDQRKE